MSVETPAQPVAPAPIAPANPAAPVNVYFQQPAAPAPAPAAPAAPAVEPAAPIAPAQPAPPIAADATIPLPKSLYDDLIAAKASLAAFQRQQEEAARAAQQEQARILAQKGEVEAALKILREQTEQQLAAERAQKAEIEERAKRYALDGVVERELAPYEFASPKLRELFAAEVRSELKVEAQGNTFSVHTPALQPAAALIAAKMAQADYQVFLKPKGNPGGGTQPNAAAPVPVNPAAQHQPVPDPAPAAVEPRNLGEKALAFLAAQKAELKGGGDPRLNREMGFALTVPTRKS